MWVAIMCIGSSGLYGSGSKGLQFQVLWLSELRLTDNVGSAANEGPCYKSSGCNPKP